VGALWQGVFCRPQSLRGVPALVWATHGPQSLRDTPQAWSVSFHDHVCPCTSLLPSLPPSISSIISPYVSFPLCLLLFLKYLCDGALWASLRAWHFGMPWAVTSASEPAVTCTGQFLATSHPGPAAAPGC